MFFGMSHALLIWYGDVLFLYSFAGLILVFLARCRTRTLLIIGGILFGFSIVISTAVILLMSS